jgi:hypothetical protein
MSEISAAEPHKASRSQIAVKLKLIDEIFRTVRTMLWCTVGVFAVIYGFTAIAAIAGKTTDFSVAVNFIQGSGAAQALTVSFTFNIAFLFLWRRERKLCQDNIERFSGIVAEKEKAIDPNRTSSGLTKRGQTPPKER